MFLCCCYGFIISLFYSWKIFPPIIDSQTSADIVLKTTVGISFLLIYRIYIAHDQLCKRNKLCRRIVNVVQNAVSGIWIYISEQEFRDRNDKEAAIRLVAAFAVGVKLYIRKEPINLELKSLVLPLQYQKLQYSKHIPLEITFWIDDYLNNQYSRKQLTFFQLTYLQHCKNEMKKIIEEFKPNFQTTFPAIYTIFLQKIMVMYFILSPLIMVENLGWQTSIAITCISFIYLFVNEIGTEIEKPSDSMNNYQPLDFVCDSIKCNVENLIKQANCSQSTQIIDLSNRVA